MKRTFASLLLLSVLVIASDKPPKTYPLHGTVVAVHVGESSQVLPVYTDSQGKTRGGQSVRYETHTYRVETEALIYELTERSRKPTLTVGDQPQFRIEKEAAYVRDGDKERKYKVTGTEQNSGKH